jgi:head-tail adaptor
MAYRQRATRYRERVTFYKPAANPTVNPDGGVDDPGDKFVSRRAKIWAVTGREQELGGQTVADVTHRVKVHKDTQTATLTARCWLIRRDGTTRLNIVRAYELFEQRGVIELECKERK